MTNARKLIGQDEVKLEGRLADFRHALREEISEVKNSGQTSTLLNAGKRIESGREGFWYRFLVDYMPVLPADTPCKLIIGTDQYEITVISAEENAVVISSRNKLPANIGKARLENGSTVLMERLIKCIEDNAEKENPAGERLFCQSNGQIYHAQKLFEYDDIHYSEQSNAGQQKAVKSALENDITYIWGPPGTGKTTVIANIIEELYRHGRSVLIVSHTNTAVDGAIQKVDKAYNAAYRNEDKAYPILRLGIPIVQLPKETLLASHVEAIGKELFAQKNMLEEQKQEILDDLEEIRIILAKAKWLRESRIHEILGICVIQLRSQEREFHFRELARKKQSEIEALIREKPELERYIQIEKERKEAVRELEKTKADIAYLQEERERTESSRNQANDEVKKHNLYEELTLKVESFMSVQYYSREIGKLDLGLRTLESTISVLSAKKKTIEEAIRKYENNNAFSRMLAGKNGYELNQRDLTSVLAELEKLSKECGQQRMLRDDYKKQLSDRQLLDQKRKALTPSKTKEYWIDEVKRLDEACKLMVSDITSLCIRRDERARHILELEERKKDGQELLDSLNSQRAELQFIEESAEKAKEDAKKKDCELTRLLDAECTVCEQFSYTCQSGGNQNKAKELSALFDQARSELNRISIQEKEKQKEDAEDKLVSVSAQLDEIKSKMAELEKQAILNARIIGTTLAKSYLNDTLRERVFDTVICDEASMASIPALWSAAYLAEKNIVIVGDFLQLPPIVMANTNMAKHWLGKDVFFHSGIQESAKMSNKNIRPENFAVLDHQYRMESDIADIANRYYGAYTKLLSDDSSPKISEEREKFYGWYSGSRKKEHVHLIDTESLHAWVTGIPQAKGHSRLNSFSASLDVDLAFRLLDKFIEQLNPENAEPLVSPKVLIVAPYKPHINLINKLIENEYLCRGLPSDLNLVRAGTIHSFQGSEADIVIFDLVIDEPHYKANLFMPDNDINTELRRMFNVAVTRARFRLFIVGDFAYCLKRAKDNELGSLLKYLLEKKKYRKIDARSEFLPKLAAHNTGDTVLRDLTEAERIICTEDDFNQYFLSDIRTFRSRMIIYSPFMTENRIGTLLPEFYTAISHGKQVIVITKPLSERGKTELAHYEMCEQGLRDIGISILHKKGMHEKTIIIDDDIIWNGSLNALSYTGNTGEIMERDRDKSKEKVLVKSFVKVLDIEYIVQAVDSARETKCPVCGSEMILKESDDGGIYWYCNEGDYSRNKDQPYPRDGILRCGKCGSDFHFSMVNQPRWICNADPKHFQVMRKNDLKLSKMASLLSQSEQKKVVQYFENLAKKRHT